jgi:hypothetical protein
VNPDPGLRGVLLLWAALLLLGFGGRLYSTDVVAQYEVAESFIGIRPLLTVSGEYGWTVDGCRPGIFVPHSIGYSLLLVPSAALGSQFGLEAGKVTAAGTNAVLSLVLVGFWFLLARRKLKDVPISRFLLVAVGGMVLVYGRMPFDVTSAAAAAMAGLYCSSRNRMYLAGLLAGTALLIRPDSILLLPLFWKDWRSALKMAVVMLPFLAAFAWSNWFRFGSPFDDGHGQDPAMTLALFRGGIPGLLLSPGKGLLYYSPMCVLALFHQRDWRYWTPFVLSLVLHGSLLDWTGGTGWGPRFLFTSLPFLLLPLCRRGAGGKPFWIIAATGVLVTAAAIWSNPSVIEQSLGPDLFDEPGRQAVIWSFSSSPLVNSILGIGRGLPDMLGVSAARAAGMPAVLGAIAQTCAAACMAAAGIVSIRGKRGRKPVDQ